MKYTKSQLLTYLKENVNKLETAVGGQVCDNTANMSLDSLYPSIENITSVSVPQENNFNYTSSIDTQNILGEMKVGIYTQFNENNLDFFPHLLAGGSLNCGCS